MNLGDARVFVDPGGRAQLGAPVFPVRTDLLFGARTLGPILAPVVEDVMPSPDPLLVELHQIQVRLARIEDLLARPPWYVRAWVSFRAALTDFLRG